MAKRYGEKDIKEPEEEWKRVWEYHKNADNLFVSRFNFFILAESMFIVSFATIVASKSSEMLIPIKIAIVILGLLFTIGWYWVNKRLLEKIWYLKYHYLEKFDRIYLDYMRAEANSKERTTRHVVQTYVLPYSTMVFWLFLLFYVILIDALRDGNSSLGILIVCFLASIGIVILIAEALKLFHYRLIKTGKIEEYLKDWFFKKEDY